MTLRIKKEIAQALEAARNGEKGVDLSQFTLPKLGGGLVKKADDDDVDRVRRFLLSNATQDRHRDTLDPEGWVLEEFEKNGAILWAHNSWEPPIATPRGVEVTGKGKKAALFGDAEFVDAYEFSKLLLKLIDHEALKNASVGFSAIEWVYNEERRGIDFLKQKLIEWSVVPIGSNPDAMVQLAKDLKLDMTPLLVWSQKWLDNDEKIGKAIADEDEVALICKALEPLALSIDPGVAPAGETDDIHEENQALKAKLAKVADWVERAKEAGVELSPVDDELETKAGRVLSKANKEKLGKVCEQMDNAKAKVLDVLASQKEDDEDDEGKGAPELTTETLDALINRAETDWADGAETAALVALLEKVKSIIDPEPFELTEDTLREMVTEALSEKLADDEPAPVSMDEAEAMVRSAVDQLTEEIQQRAGRLPR